MKKIGGFSMIAAPIIVGLSAAPATASKSKKTPSPSAIVTVMTGRSLGTNWTPFAVQTPVGGALAVEAAKSGSLGIAYFAFSTSKKALAFEKKPPLVAATIAGAANPFAYVYAAQQGFSSQKLINESTVFTFSGGVGIFLQQGTTVVLGTYLGAAAANGSGFNLEAVGVSKATQNAAKLLTAKPSAKKAPEVPAGFNGINDKSMPGLPSSNWPKIQFVGSVPPAALSAASVSSGDLTYTVTFYNFSSPGAATAFYNAPPGAMLSFLGGALGYSPLAGATGIPGQSRGVDLRTCTGEGSGPTLLPTGECSNGSGSFSAGVGTIVQVGSVVMMVGYLSSNLPITANPSDLSKNVKIASSGLLLLKSLGIS